MEKIRMLGVVTLYNTTKEQTLKNISLYAPHLDKLVVWDNNEENHQAWFTDANTVYHWTGENTLIAPAVNYAWRLAEAEGYDAILLMDDDSQWTDFPSYRKDIEIQMKQGAEIVFTPYVKGCDDFEITNDQQERRLFINSGTVIPTAIFRSIGGVDEEAFPLDALDHDIAFSIREKGYKAVCLTQHVLNHSLGYPQRMGPFHLFTPNYNRLRTYNMTRSHIICYRKHKPLMTKEDKDYLFNEIIRRKFVRILLAEPDKLGRMSALIRGIVSGCRYKLKKT
jgi:Predicted glycosyltransferases